MSRRRKDNRPVSGDMVVLQLTRGLHGVISLLERWSNSGGGFNPQATKEVLGAKLRLTILEESIKQGVNLADVKGIDNKTLEQAYLD